MPGHELIGPEESRAVQEIFDTGGVLFAHGYHDRRQGVYRVREFEKEIAAYFDVKHAVAVNTGTAAVKVALAAAGVRPGDEVITQAFTFVATVEAILDLGARPVILNVDESLNLDPGETAAAITARTRAILPVHMHGAAADLGALEKIARERGLRLIEDSCQGLGAKWNGRWLGSIGDAGTYSFDYNKAITTGEGGMVLTNDDAIGKFAREYHDHGHENNPALPRGRDTRTIYGFNYRMTEMQAAVGRVQLRKFADLLEGNRQRYQVFEACLKPLVPMRKIFAESQPMWDTVMFLVEDPARRQAVIARLNESGIGTKNVPDAVEWHFAGHWDHMLTDEERARLQPTARLLERYVSVPIWLKKSVEEYARLGESLAKILA